MPSHTLQARGLHRQIGLQLLQLLPGTAALLLIWLLQVADMYGPSACQELCNDQRLCLDGLQLQPPQFASGTAANHADQVLRHALSA